LIGIDCEHLAFLFARDIDFAVLRIHTNAFRFLRHFDFSTGLPGTEINNQSARIIFIRDKSNFPSLLIANCFRVRPDMPAIDQFVLDRVDYSKPVGSFVRWRAIFIQTGAIRGEPLTVTKSRLPSGAA